MSESPEREREIATAAIFEMLKKHKAAGFDVSVMLDSMSLAADHGLERLVGSERMAKRYQNLADAAALRATRPALNLADPTPDDARIYVAQALDEAPAALDRNSIYMAAVMHGAMSLVARRGAGEVREVLRDLDGQIADGVATRQLRSGDIARDYD